MDTKAYIESGIIESCVLGLASAEEAAELELLMHQHTDIKNAVDDFAASIEQQVLQNAIIPPAQVKDKLMRLLSGEFSAEKNVANPAPVIPFEDKKIDTAKIISIWKYAAAASIIFLIASAALNFYYYGKYNSVKNDYQALLTERNTLQANNDIFKTKLNDVNESIRLMADPVMEAVKMNAVPGKEGSLATVYWNTKTKDVYLLQNNLPQTPADKQYQLWAIVDGKPVSAGVISDCNGLCKLNNIPKAQAFAITLEKKGGSDSPTLTAMFVIGNV